MVLWQSELGMGREGRGGKWKGRQKKVKKKNEVEKKKMKRKDRGVGWRESCSGKREEKIKK